MATNRFCYAVPGDTPNGKWMLIPDTPDNRISAIEKGARHFSIYSFSADPDVEKDVIRYGDLIIDFDSPIPLEAIQAAQDFVRVLNAFFGVHIEELRYWLTGGKGAHLAIPAELFGGEDGDAELPRIHRRMLEKLTNDFSGDFGKKFNLIDVQLYAMGKGHILRVANQRRANGRYKVQVSGSTFMNITQQDELDMLTSSPAEEEMVVHPVRNELFHEFYLNCVKTFKEAQLNPIKAAEALDEKCKFFKHCYEDAETLNYTAWFAMLTNFAKLGAMGKEMAHTYSKLSSRYDAKEVDRKLKEASKLEPYSCEKIRNSIFNCGCDCGVKFPYLLSIQGSDSKSLGFYNTKDSLCYGYLSDGQIVTEKICSPLEVIAYSRDQQGLGWGRIVRLTDPSGVIRTIVLPMSEIVTSPENTLRKLIDHGLQLASYGHSKHQVLQYLTESSSTTYAKVVKKCGWDGACYVLKGAVLGDSRGEIFILENNFSEPSLQEQGTLEEWKEHVGKLCEDQPLLQLALAFSLTGILLSPCGYEGGGLHFFGPCSTGKTTALIVAGSTYGGGPKGYIKQWRTTDNALESTATMHNDGFLCLDEIGQASSKVVSETAYMVINGQSKARANREGNARPVTTWSLCFMSTGELTLADSIALDFGRETMAGQHVRILDIPTNAGTGYGVFTFIPEGMTAGSFSQLLVHNCKQFYGTPARTFIEKFAEDFEKNVERVKKDVSEFIKAHAPEGCSGQVIRALQRFALIATAGELAIEWKIFPWSTGSVRKSAQFGMEKWIEQRGGIGDQEQVNAINRLMEFIERKENRFYNLDNREARLPNDIAGYRWYQRETDEHFYGFIPEVFQREICRTLNANAVKNELLQKGWMGMTRMNTPMASKSVNGRNKRVVVVVPSRWSPTTSDDEPQLELDTENIF